MHFAYQAVHVHGRRLARLARRRGFRLAYLGSPPEFGGELFGGQVAEWLKAFAERGQVGSPLASSGLEQAAKMD
jgi:hypothetical protein